MVRPWTNFASWLEHKVEVPAKNQTYWINGKAGSGKSTLMKFILEHDKLYESLRKWAGSSTLLILNFFG